VVIQADSPQASICSGTVSTRFLQARCPTYHPTNSIKALRETQSSDADHWPNHIHSTFTTGRHIRSALLLCGVTTHLMSISQSKQICTVHMLQVNDQRQSKPHYGTSMSWPFISSAALSTMNQVRHAGKTCGSHQVGTKL